jgi:hypothetical protein
MMFLFLFLSVHYGGFAIMNKLCVLRSRIWLGMVKCSKLSLSLFKDKLEIFGYHVFPNNISDKNCLYIFFNLIL